MEKNQNRQTKKNNLVMDTPLPLNRERFLG